MQRRPRVLLAAEALVPGANGIGRVARLMAKFLIEEFRAGHLDVQAVTLSDRAPSRDLELPIIACGRSRARFVWECQRAALNSTHYLYDFAGMGRAHVAVARARPNLVWMHGVEVWEGTRKDRLKVLRSANVVVSNTDYTVRRAFNLHGPFASPKVCWLATETDASPPRSREQRAASSVLILGRLDAGGGRKGHRQLIDVWPRVVARVPDARLIIAGGGPGEALIRSWVAASPACQSIDVLGFVPEHELEATWARAGIFAMPSRGEGFGLTYIEAMRHSLPVIGSIHDAAVEVNVDGETGWNVDLDAAGQLEGRILQLLENSSLREQMGASGFERWARHFSYNAFRARFSPILDDFLKQ